MRKISLLLAGTLIASFCFISLPTPATAQDDFSFESDKWSGPRSQIGLRVALRTDETRYHNYQPSGGLRLFYWAVPWSAWVLSGNYSSHSRFGSNTSYESLVVDFCWRMQRPEKVISPFFETGPSFARYWVRSRGDELADSQFGLRLAVGLNFKLSSSNSLDFNISQVLNRGPRDIYILGSPIGAPCPVGVDCGYPSYIPHDVYNDTNIELTFRFGL